jgi:hypothetical protein
VSRKTTTTNGQNPAVRAFFPLTMVRSLVLSGILQTHPTIKIHKQRLFRGVDRASKQRAGRPVSKLAQRTSPSTRTDFCPARGQNRGPCKNSHNQPHHQFLSKSVVRTMNLTLMKTYNVRLMEAGWFVFFKDVNLQTNKQRKPSRLSSIT